MGSRGRKSAAELSIIRAEQAFKPKAPRELSEEQAAEWKSVVDRLPGNWFSRENTALLVQYCRHVVAARRVAQLIKVAEEGEEFSLQDYDRLLKMQEREGRALSSLAVRMRLTQSSRLKAETAATAVARDPGVRPPWEPR
jgi:hypothetical protein